MSSHLHVESSRPMVPAATVMVLRDGPQGPETLMLRKNSDIAFGGMWVFPGGKVDDLDHPEGGDDVEAARNAARRECREETQLELAEEKMVLFAQWIPPPVTPKLYVTWFFASPTSSGEAVIDQGEIVDMEWMTPDSALRRHREGAMKMAPPTWVSLDRLRRHTSTSEILTTLAQRPVRRHATKLVTDVDSQIALWEGDAGYESSDALATGPRHRLTMAQAGYRYEDDGAA